METNQQQQQQQVKNLQLDIYCDIHKNMKIILICKECIKPLCALCLTEHQSLAHKLGADLYEGIDRFFNYRLMNQELKKSLKDQKQILNQRLKQIESQKIDNDKKATNVIDTLKQKLIKLLDDKKPEVAKLLEDEKRNTILAYKQYNNLFNDKNLKQLQDLCCYEKQYQQLGIEKSIQQLISQLDLESLPEQAIDTMLQELINTLRYSKSSLESTYHEQLDQALKYLEKFGKIEEKNSKPDWDFSKILQSPNTKPKSTTTNHIPNNTNNNNTNNNTNNNISKKPIAIKSKASLQPIQQQKQQQQQPKSTYSDEYSYEDEQSQQDEQDKLSSDNNSVDNMNNFRQMIKQSIQQRGVGNGLINKDQLVEQKQQIQQQPERNKSRSRSRKGKLNNENERHGNNNHSKQQQSDKKITRKRQTSKMVNASKRNKSNNNNEFNPMIKKKIN